jgi:Nif-specific regulatory protein
VQKLKSHHWPGNVRELRNGIDRAVLLSQGSSCIEADHILVAQSSAADPSATRLDHLEFQHIMQVLTRVGGNKAKAAALLGIERSTLLRKLQRFKPSGPAANEK